MEAYLVNRQLVNRHYVNRHLVESHSVDRHLANSTNSLVEEQLANTSHLTLSGPNVCRPNDFSLKDEKPLQEETLPLLF
jgi:hypothetical protein